MIKDRIENGSAYASLGPGIARAMEYLQGHDLSGIQAGKYEIDGQNVFATVQRYQPKPLDSAVWESHLRYIDVQYVVSGVERMGHRSLLAKPKVVKPYDPQTDLVFYESGIDLLVFHPGEFAIFTPQDVHAPGLCMDAAGPQSEVLKIVVKVRVNGDSGPCGF
jgi:YhcH/YjgK/YiaL family protein